MGAQPPTYRADGGRPAAGRGGPQSIAKDDAFHLLQNSRRRAALRYLFEHGGPIELRDLAEAVAAWEHDTTPEALTSAQRQRVYIALYQSHLPKLADHGVVDYNQDRGIVELQPLARVLEPFLEVGLDAEETLTLDDVDGDDGGGDGDDEGGDGDDGDDGWRSRVGSLFGG